MLQKLEDIVSAHPLQVKFHTPVLDVVGYLVELGGAQKDIDTFGRLFEELQQNVPGCPGEPLYLIEDHRYVTAEGVGEQFDQVTGVIGTIEVGGVPLA